MHLLSTTSNSPGRVVTARTDPADDRARPIVYSCSGCSSAAQMANDLAVRLDRSGIAEMSCIAGVGGGVGSLVRMAMSDRPIVTIDGCKLKCCQACLDSIDLTPTLGFVLSEMGVAKVRHAPYDAEQAARIYIAVRREILGIRASRRALSNNGSPITPE